MSKVIGITEDEIKFDDGYKLYSKHIGDCCEEHYLGLADLDLGDFQGLEFDLEGDFFERIDGYGIALKPKWGLAVRIPGYGFNNGYYSTDLELVVEDNKGRTKVYDITECQHIED